MALLQSVRRNRSSKNRTVEGGDSKENPPFYFARHFGMSSSFALYQGSRFCGKSTLFLVRSLDRTESARWMSLEPPFSKEHRSGKQVHQRAGGHHKAAFRAALKVDRRKRKGLAPNQKASAAMARPFVQDVPQHIGENPNRADGDWVKRSSRVACCFLLVGGLHLRANVAQRIKDRHTSADLKAVPTQLRCDKSAEDGSEVDP